MKIFNEYVRGLREVKARRKGNGVEEKEKEKEKENEKEHKKEKRKSNLGYDPSIYLGALFCAYLHTYIHTYIHTRF